MYQPQLFDDKKGIADNNEPVEIKVPTTRYQGSKFKLLPWIWENVKDLHFASALDAFGGTGSVAYLFKLKGKAVTYNDALEFNSIIGKAYIENQTVTLADEDVNFVFQRDPNFNYDNFIARTFKDISFTNEENDWLDVVCQNIPRIENEYKRALAYYALFQSCIIKRPYNLFHRANLYMRTAEVERNFGNKKTWDTPFEEHFRNFVTEINGFIFNSGVPCQALHCDNMQIPGEYDLVYIDTPYISGKGVGTDYLDFYHFLEGMVNYQTWGNRIDYTRKHRPLKAERSPWCDKKRIKGAFEKLFQKYRNSIIVVSYRSDGIPSEDELATMLRKVKRQVDVVHYGEYKYVLSTNGNSHEILLMGY